VVLEPEDDVVLLPPAEGLGAERQAVAGDVQVRLDRVVGAQPGEVRAAVSGLLGGRVEEQQPLAVVDRVGGDELPPRLIRLPVGMRRLPVPHAWPQLAHAAMLSEPPSLPNRTG
jgi:hypothetical protein